VERRSTAACDCGVAYVPAGQRAAEAVQKSPEKSNRAIAAEIGVDHKTVAKARGDNSPPERVTGRDGKSYPARQTPQSELRDSDGRMISTDPKVIAKALRDDVFLPDGSAWPIQEDCPDCDSEQERWQHSLGHFAGDAVAIPAFWTREFGAWEKFEVPSDLVTLARGAAKVWTELATDLADRHDTAIPPLPY